MDPIKKEEEMNRIKESNQRWMFRIGMVIVLMLSVATIGAIWVLHGVSNDLKRLTPVTNMDSGEVILGHRVDAYGTSYLLTESGWKVEIN